MTTEVLVLLLAVAALGVSLLFSRLPRRSRDYFRLAAGFGLIAMGLANTSSDAPLLGYSLTAFGLGMVIWGAWSLRLAGDLEDEVQVVDLD